jgi:outer membrane protein TolC
MSCAIRCGAAVLAVAVLAGCAAVDIDEAVREADTRAGAFTGGALRLERTAAQRERGAALADELLAAPLSRDDAVRLALTRSPAVQALLAQGWADLAAARQIGRLPNPVFSFERVRLGGEVEFGRLLSVGLVDLLLWPQRRALSEGQVAQARLQLAAGVVDQVTAVRQAWTRAVAARQLLHYARQVDRSAQASAELARRMRQAGNFSRLQQARQQVFHADAVTRLAQAQHADVAAREALVRALGLDEAQAARLTLPERLPDLPPAPRAPEEVAARAGDERLDVRLARARLDVAGRAQGLNLLPSIVDVDVGARRDTVVDEAAGTRGTRRGVELDLRLPLFDAGGALREALDARSLAAARRYDAAVLGAVSQLREGYSAYRTAYDVARHERDEVVPLRQVIADENLLRYNGMFIGVFELLAEAREQVAGVTRVIEAQRQFWLADAALAATVIGRPEPGAAPVAGVVPFAGAASPFAAPATGIAPAAGH